jgi:DNA modification methylase
MGSGSTAIAALKTERRYIGSELDKKYYGISQKRIQKELKKGRIF